MTIGVGVIGCGGMGSWHATNLAAQPGIAVVAVADAVPAAAERVARGLGARVLDGLDVVAAADVDAVLIASSDDTHATFAVAAIEAGKPCFCEKPLGVTIGQATAVLDAELAAGRLLTRVGFMRELDPAHRQLADALGTLGAITRVRSVHRNVDGSPREVEDLFSQSLVHDIHTIRWLTGQEFTRVTVHMVTRDDGFRDVMLVGNLADGAMGIIDFEDHGFAYEVQLEVTAVGGMVSTLAHPRSMTRVDASECLHVGVDWFARFEDAYRIEIEEWTRCLHDGSFAGPTVWDGYAAQVVARAGQVAMMSGTPCDVELAPKPLLYGGEQ